MNWVLEEDLDGNLGEELALEGLEEQEWRGLGKQELQEEDNREGERL